MSKKNNKKKPYVKPEIEVIEIEQEDIITTSGAPQTVEAALFGGHGGAKVN